VTLISITRSKRYRDFLSLLCILVNDAAFQGKKLNKIRKAPTMSRLVKLDILINDRFEKLLLAAALFRFAVPGGL